MNLVWSDDLSVGVAEIDQQHKELISMINDLSRALGEGRGREELGGILSNLAEYSRIHFFTEEKLFQVHKYPEAEAHEREHNMFARKVGDFMRRISLEEEDLSSEVFDFMSDWLLSHIKGEDFKYIPYLS